jgi:hypothetical protein
MCAHPHPKSPKSQRLNQLGTIVTSHNYSDLLSSIVLINYNVALPQFRHVLNGGSGALFVQLSKRHRTRYRTSTRFVFKQPRLSYSEGDPPILPTTSRMYLANLLIRSPGSRADSPTGSRVRSTMCCRRSARLHRKWRPSTFFRFTPLINTWAFCFTPRFSLIAFLMNCRILDRLSSPSVHLPFSPSHSPSPFHPLF